MGQMSAKLRSTEAGLAHWCPGCDKMHSIPEYRMGWPSWTFDGNVDQPTFSPSVLHYWREGEEETEKRCHYFLTAGVLHYCGDSSHPLAGQNVPLPDLPMALRDNG